MGVMGGGPSRELRVHRVLASAGPTRTRRSSLMPRSGPWQDGWDVRENATELRRGVLRGSLRNLSSRALLTSCSSSSPRLHPASPSTHVPAAVRAPARSCGHGRCECGIRRSSRGFGQPGTRFSPGWGCRGKPGRWFRVFWRRGRGPAGSGPVRAAPCRRGSRSRTGSGPVRRGPTAVSVLRDRG